MGKTAVIFPGQGAQYVGMAKDFYDNFEDSREVIEKADSVLDIDLKKICFEENEDINKTEFTQPAMVAAELAIYAHVKNMGLKADVFAGLSLGEYSALTACGAMKLEDAIQTVRQRGILMQNEVPLGQGAMAAVIATDAEVIAKRFAKKHREMSRLPIITVQDRLLFPVKQKRWIRHVKRCRQQVQNV